MRQRQPEQELLWSFIRDLQEAKDFVHEALLAGWAVDAAINEMRTTVYSRLSEYETLQLTARASLIVTLKTMGSLLALALVLCVIGDMLAAIINMARNSEEMKATLSAITLQTDNE